MEAQSFAVHIRLTASGSRFPATVMFAEWRYLRSGLSSQDCASFPRGWVTAREAQPGGRFNSAGDHTISPASATFLSLGPRSSDSRRRGWFSSEHTVGCASHEARVVPSAASGSVPATTRRRRATPGSRPRPGPRPSGTLVVLLCHQVMRPARRPLGGCGQRGRLRFGRARSEGACREAVRIGRVSTAVRNAASPASSATKRIPGAAKRSVTISGSRARPAPAATASSTRSTRGSACLRTAARVRRYGTLRPSRCRIGVASRGARPAGPAPAARGDRGGDGVRCGSPQHLHGALLPKWCHAGPVVGASRLVMTASSRRSRTSSMSRRGARS